MQEIDDSKYNAGASPEKVKESKSKDKSPNHLLSPDKTHLVELTFVDEEVADDDEAEQIKQAL